MRAKDVTGRWGEDLAVAHLQAAGLTVVERNWRCAEGEIDIVAREGPCLAFCEVKTRSSTAFGDPAEAVVGRKYRRLRGLARRWLLEHPDVHVPEIRLDVVAIVRPRVGAPTVRHLRGIEG